jgi:hypothetical protein
MNLRSSRLYQFSLALLLGAIVAMLGAQRPAVAEVAPDTGGLWRLLAATSGHVVFTTGEELPAVRSGLNPQAIAEVSCITPYSGPVHCPERQFVIRGVDIVAALTSPTQKSVTVAMHELGHVLDGMDDGNFNGSPGHPWSQELQRLHYGNPLHSYHRLCVSNLSEWYACEVGRTGAVK